VIIILNRGLIPSK